MGQWKSRPGLAYAEREMSAPTDLRPCPFCGYFQAATPCSSCGGEVLDAPLGVPVRPRRQVWIAELAQGFVTFYRAAIHLLTRPEYFGRLTVPVVANLIAMAALAALSFYPIHGAMTWVIAQHWAWVDALPWRVGWDDASAATALTIVTVLFLGPVVIQTITIPFLDPLADAVEKMLGGPNMRAVDQSSWRTLMTNVRASAQVLAMQLLLVVPCLLLSFCQLGVLVAAAIAAFLNALLWFEIPFERRGYTIDQRIIIIRHNWARALGFGIGFQLGLFIPFFNVFLLAPTAAVAVTMTYFHFEKVPRLGIVRPPPKVERAAQSGDPSPGETASTDG